MALEEKRVYLGINELSYEFRSDSLGTTREVRTKGKVFNVRTLLDWDLKFFNSIATLSSPIGIYAAHFQQIFALERRRNLQAEPFG